MRILAAIAFAAIFSVGADSATGQTDDAKAVATLYRSSIVIKDARIHIATFDADKASGGENFSYNWENCVLAAELFQAQPGVKTKFWCEKGPYRKFPGGHNARNL